MGDSRSAPRGSGPPARSCGDEPRVAACLCYPNHESPGLDLNSVFVKRFGDLVALMRVDPGNDAAQDLALTAATRAVALAPVEVDVASEGSGSPEGLSLRARMIARQVDRLRVAAGAEPYELEAVARALAHDLIPIPATPHIQVERMRLLAPPSR